MTLTLLAVSLNDIPLSQPITASFDGRGGTIGRADHNTMALPDPERHISRLQAEVSKVAASFRIKNVGAANPISVARRPLAAGESSALADGDEVRIGGYLLRVIDGHSSNLAGAKVARGRAMVNDTLAGQALPPMADTSPALRRPVLAKAPAPAAAPFRAATAAPAPVEAPIAAPHQALRPAYIAPQGQSAGGASGSALPKLAEPLSSHNPFADLLGTAVSAPPAGAGRAGPPAADPFADLFSPAAGVPAASPAWASAPTAAPAPLLPEDFDPFAAPAPQRGKAAPRAPTDPFADLMPAGDARSIDALFDLGNGGAAADALARFGSQSPAAGHARLEAGTSTDPMAMFGDAAAPAPAAAPAANHTPNLRAAFVPPKPLAPRASAPPSVASASAPLQAPAAAAPAHAQAPVIPLDATWLRPGAAHLPAPLEQAVPTPALRPWPAHPPPSANTEASDAIEFGFALDPAVAKPSRATSLAATEETAAPPAAATAPSGDALWQAFCAGAQLDLPLPQGLSPHTMHEIGALLHAAVAGAMQLMAVRASTKQELRADVTMIQQRANNPMKFSPDAQTALEQLLRPPMRGFLPGPEAMTEAMNDLVGHSIGTMAGMRAALDGVLGRFAPEQLESKLSGTSLLDSLLPMNRKGRLWDLYLQHFDGIRDEAQDDFHTLFGKAFLAAYKQQLERLRPGRGAE